MRCHHFITPATTTEPGDVVTPVRATRLPTTRHRAVSLVALGEKSLFGLRASRAYLDEFSAEADHRRQREANAVQAVFGDARETRKRAQGPACPTPRPPYIPIHVPSASYVIGVGGALSKPRSIRT